MKPIQFSCVIVRALLVVALDFGSVLVAHAAPGSDTTAPFLLKVDSDSACLTERLLYTRILATSGPVRAARPGEVPTNFVVSLVTEPAGVVTSLTVVDGAGMSDVRTVRARDCEEALSAMAMIAALALAQRDLSRPANEDSIRAEPPAPRPQLEPRAEAQAPAVTARSTTAVHPQVALGALFEPETGGALATSFGPTASFGLLFDTGTVFSPEVRLTLAFQMGKRVLTSAGAATPRWMTGDVAFCPVRATAVGVSACADVQSGVISVQTSGPLTENASKPWLTAGVFATGEWPFAGWSRTTPFFLQVDAGIRRAILLDRFYFLSASDGLLAYETKEWAFRSNVSIGVRFR